MCDNNYTVYRHVAPNGKIYVGITRRPLKERWLNGRGYKRNPYFSRAIEKYGWDNFKHEVLLKGLRKEEAELAERLFIGCWDLMNPEHGYNLDSGGAANKIPSDETRRRMSESHKGLRHSEETKRKISESQTGKKNHMYGKSGELSPVYGRKHSAETRRKISEAQRREKNHMYGKRFQHSKETKEKISQARKGKCKGKDHPNYGKHLSKETRKKISNSKEKCRVAMIDKSTGQIICVFPSITDAERETGINNPHICSCCKGRRKTAGGYIWKYADNKK